MNEIEQAIRDLQLYSDVRWGGTNDMFNLALTALREKAERKVDDNTIKAMQKHIKTLQQKNEQLRAQVARMREALIFTKEKIYEQLSNYVNDPKKFKYSTISIECVQKIVRALADASDYHNPADVAEIEKLRNVIEEIKDNLHAINCVREMPDKVEMYANEAISIIDEMGGKNDV